MENITVKLGKIVSDAFVKAGYGGDSAPAVTVTLSDRPDLCQFQSNSAFAYSKVFRKAPFMISDDVAKVLNDSDILTAESVKPGFININLKDSYILSLLQELAEDEHYGIAQQSGKLVMDYGGPNVAKPLHIGHLRSAIIGQSLKNIARMCGLTVTSDIHLGDWGLQIGLVIAELADRHPEWNCFAENYDGSPVPELDVDLLNEVYPTASARSKTDEAFAAKAHTATFELQSGRAGYMALWREIMRVSCEDLKKNYDALGVDFDCWYGESDADKYIPGLYALLEEKGLSYESDGALVVDVAKEDDKSPVPPIIVRKSDNSSIYATTDLATIIQRQQDFAPDMIWYVVDNRQEFHFTQVFRCARLAGLVPEDTKLEFLGFGTMNGKDGKPYKTREGGVMRLSDLIGTVCEAARARLDESGKVDESEREEYAKRIGIAAIKFGDLINHRSKDYIFDLDKFLSADGKTGVYVLYAVSRINSVMAKAANEKGSFEVISTDSERALALKLISSPESFGAALRERAPSFVCDDMYNLAAAFSGFYHENRIADEEDASKRSTRLALCALTRRMITAELDALGIKPVEKM
ncbi:MAG: arginine--tRNA ligase [Oscillospiraceae bacterium]|nr:arginine--tRNA ligase [Oscillospiraceae bacterium]